MVCLDRAIQFLSYAVFGCRNMIIYEVFTSAVHILIRSVQKTGLQKPVDIFIDTKASLDSTYYKV